LHLGQAKVRKMLGIGSTDFLPNLVEAQDGYFANEIVHKREFIDSGITQRKLPYDLRKVL